MKNKLIKNYKKDLDTLESELNSLKCLRIVLVQSLIEIMESDCICSVGCGPCFDILQGIADKALQINTRFNKETRI